MRNSYFQFKQFIVHQEQSAMKVTTDACLFGAWVAKKIHSESKAIRSLLDIGTGTGLLALMVAQQNERLIIDALEIDKAAAAEATANCEASPWATRINILQADANEFKSNRQYDLIISNPPFYEEQLKSPDPLKNKAHHSSELTLEQLVATIDKQLAPGGRFFLLLPVKRQSDIMLLVKERHFHIDEIMMVKQTPQHPWFRLMIAGSRAGNKLTETYFDEMVIKEGQDYSRAFTSLLKDYYLYL